VLNDCVGRSERVEIRFLCTTCNPCRVCNRLIELRHQIAADRIVCLFVLGFVAGTDILHDLGTAPKRPLGSLEVKQNPKLKAWNGDCFRDWQRAARPAGKMLDSVPGSVKTFMAVSVKDAEDTIIGALLANYFLGGLNYRDRRRTTRIVCNPNFGGGEPEMITRRPEVQPLGFALAYD
jgi:hypothetical protein